MLHTSPTPIASLRKLGMGAGKKDADEIIPMDEEEVLEHDEKSRDF